MKKHKSHLQKNPSGMTLVEILFAFAIMGSIITLSYSSALRGWRSAQVANQRTQAQYVAQDAIERVKAYRDLNITDITQTQRRMQWAGAPNGLGSGGFLQSIGVIGPHTGSFSNQFVVIPCDTTVPEDCYWKVTGPQASQAISDSTVYNVAIEVTDVSCPDPANPCALEDLGSITIQAIVNYTDALGIDSNAVASTIVTRSEY